MDMEIYLTVFLFVIMTIQSDETFPVPVGCYLWNALFTEQDGVYTEPLLCSQHCSDLNMTFANVSYFALKNTTCYCGGDIKLGLDVTGTPLCNMSQFSCQYPCGGENGIHSYVSVYEIYSNMSNHTSSLDEEEGFDWRHIGCDVHQESFRPVGDGFLSSVSCNQACFSLNLSHGNISHSALENRICYCLESSAKELRQLDSDSTKISNQSAENKTECVSLNATDREFKGCFIFSEEVDNGVFEFALSWWPFIHSETPLEICVQECADAGFRLAGMVNGFQCLCGNTGYDKIGVSVACKELCYNKTCGGSNDISVYSTEVDIYDERYIGCYKDIESIAGFTPNRTAGKPIMTIDICIKICNETDLSYAALQNGNWCFCVKKLVFTFKFNIDGQFCKRDCYVPCSGNKVEKCGGVQSVSVFRAEIRDDEHKQITVSVLTTSEYIMLGTEQQRGEEKNTLNAGDNNATKKPEEGSDIALIIGVILVCIVVMVTVIFFGAFIYKRRKAFYKEQDLEMKVSQSEQMNGIAGSILHGEKEPGGPSSIEDVSIPSEAEEQVEEDQESAHQVSLPVRMKPVLLGDLASYVARLRDNMSSLEEEFMSFLEMPQPSWNIANDSEIRKAKNRFKNILAYDHSRVKLQREDDDLNSDYINASYIHDYKSKKSFIAAQGPMPTTLFDFWRMIWEQNVPNIVMLTNIVETGRVKCEQYWPEGENLSVFYGCIEIRLIKEEIWPDYCVRTINIIKNDGKKSVKQWHYTGWPDHGVPDHATPILNFLRKVKAAFSPTSGPTLIHCSAGVGRTGTFLALDYLLNQAEAEGLVDVYCCVHRMRRDRVNMVQTLEQYLFLHTAILEALTVGETTIPCYKFHSTVPTLLEPAKNTTSNKIQEQFNLLELLKPSDSEVKHLDGLKEENKDKNRDLNIIPENGTRVRLRVATCDESDYINAVYVNGYRRQWCYIATQMPLESERSNFWKMVLQKNIYVIVSLQEKDRGHLYWPLAVGTASTQGGITVYCHSVSTQGCVTSYKLKLNINHQVSLVTLHHLDWTTSSVLDDLAVDILTLNEITLQSQRKSSTGPLLVQCFNGADACGIFCAASCLIDMMNSDQEVDVFRITQLIRTTRKQFITDINQYELLYQMVEDYIELFSDYSNFGAGQMEQYKRISVMSAKGKGQPLDNGGTPSGNHETEANFGPISEPKSEPKSEPNSEVNSEANSVPKSEPNPEVEQNYEQISEPNFATNSENGQNSEQDFDPNS